MDSTTGLIGFAATALGGYFAIMNPISGTATFIGITAGHDHATKKAIAKQSLLLAFAIIAVVSVAGNLIFKVFGITLSSIRITGGIVVFVIGYNMLMGSGAAAHAPTKDDIASSRAARLSVAISPLAVPLLAGPGTIATAMSFAAGGWLHIAVSLTAFAVICFVTYLCFSDTGRESLRWHGINDGKAVTYDTEPYVGRGTGAAVWFFSMAASGLASLISECFGEILLRRKDPLMSQSGCAKEANNYNPRLQGQNSNA